jgi:hypothetical protein
VYGRFLSAFHVFSVLLTLAYAVHAQTFQVLHTFEGPDGISPGALVIDSGGNLYGTAARGGIDNCSTFGCGTVFDLSPSQSGWSFATLYKFQSRTDGWNPASPLTIGPGGIFYGATTDGGIEGGGGTVFRIAPICTDPSCKQRLWAKATLYRFGQCNGAGTNGGLVLDRFNFYGIAHGDPGPSVAFKLTKSGDSWVISQLYTFLPGQAQAITSGFLMDAAGNLYGVGGGGAFGHGAVYELTQTPNGWSYSTISDFTGGSDGAFPSGPLTMDASGNLHGSSSAGGDLNCNAGVGCGTV